MVAVASLPTAAPPTEDQSIVLFNVAWKDYVILREALDIPGLRMAYCEGVLEIMSPARAHEIAKKTVARLIELYALVNGLPLIGYGSTTFKSEAVERGAEPDECYRVGSQMNDGEFPDIVLEVIHKNPFLDKLKIYDGLRVPEVWLWREHAFEIYLRNARGGYKRAKTSALLPELDFEGLTPYVERDDQDVAVHELATSLGLRLPAPRKKKTKSPKRPTSRRP